VENAAYIGLSRQMTLRRELDIVANNIANADTTGFKVEQLLVGEEVGERARNAFVRPGVSFVLDNGVGRDYGQAPLAQTSRNLDFAIEGEGAFFKVVDGLGDGYTRDGAFTIDGEGRLTTEGGAAVQGDSGDIILDPALGEPAVAPDGTISQNGAPVGRLSVVRFDTLAPSRRAATACIATPPTPPPSRRPTPACVRACWRARTSIQSSKSPI
jgi:flagellar basal-body rod protein FlgF